MDSVCVCIPVRYDSVRLPGKALMKLDGKTVIRRTWEQAMKSKYVDENNLFVFTDHDGIATEIRDLGGKVIMTPEPCENALVRLSKYCDLLPDDYKAIINLHGDEPYLNPKVIDFLCEKWSQYQYGIMLCQKIQPERAADPSVVKIITNYSNTLLYCSRAPIPATKNGMISMERDYYGIVGTHILPKHVVSDYTRDNRCNVYKQEDIEELKILEMGYTVKCFEVPYETDRSLNTPEDLTYLKEKYSLPNE